MNVKNDTISRKLAIETALNYMVEFYGAAFDEAMQERLVKIFEELPSAQPDDNIN